MEKKVKLVTNFSNKSVLQLLDKAKHIAFCLEELPNKALTTQVPFYDDLINAINALEACHERCKTDSTAITERKILQKNMIAVINKIKSYLEAYYIDEPAILATTGFDLKKAPQPIPEPGAPIDFMIKVSFEGMVDLKVKSTKSALAYEFCYRLADTDTWVFISQATPKCTLRGLISGQKYDFKVAYIGKKPLKIYSDILSTFIL